MTQNKKQSYFSVAKELLVLLIIVFIVRTWGFGLYQVPSGSMETTILVGERFFADKFTIMFSSPKRGDVIAFNEPAPLFNYSDNSLMRWFQMYVWGPRNLTKRVIAIPGDTIKGVVEDGKPVLYLNGKKLNEPYLNTLPLIRIWTQDPAHIAKQAEYEVAKGIQEGFIDQSKAQEALHLLMVTGFPRVPEPTALRSFDPNVSWQMQPYYRIQTDRIIMGVDNKPLQILYPDTPSLPAHTPTKRGTSYWGANSDEFYVELGANQYWCMGDNRQGSGDSRTFGPVDGTLIHGKIIFRIWSLDSAESWWIVDLIKHPIDFWKRIRWNRFFQVVK